MTKAIPIEETIQLLREYPDENLECRDLMHAWKRVGYYRGADGTRRRLLRCMRCKSEGVDRLNAQGYREKPRIYRYVDGYRIGALERYEIRAESMRRSKVYRSESAMMAELFPNANGNGKTAAGKRRARAAARS